MMTTADGRRPRFDWTISIGNVLTMLVMIAGMVAAWVDMNNRLTAVEVHNVARATADIERKVSFDEKFRDLSSNISEIRRDVRDANSAVQSLVVSLERRRDPKQ
jgi:hypothetical protein